MADLRIDLAAEFKGKKAFKEADSAVGSLDKAVGKLGKQLASVFAAQKIYAFGKASVQAFAQDQAAATRLAKVVDNLGLSFANPAITQYIQNLEKQSGILDDNLRPAFQSLLTTTGDVQKSMQLLNSAIDISRGSGIDLATVTQDLANGYVGITRGLKKYNLGLSQAQLKSKSFTEIMTLLNQQFSGSSQEYLNTYAGKMDVLNVAADNVKETIGKGLIDALITLGGQDTNVQDVANAMQNLATYTANAAVGAADLIKQLSGIPGLTSIGQILKGAFLALPPLQALSALANRGKNIQKTGYGDYAMSTDAYKRAQDAKAAAKAKATADAKAAALAKSQVKAQQQLTAEQKKQAALKKDAGIFDMQQIQLIAALKGQLSDDDRKRAELQLALLNGSVDEADKLTKQILMAQDATGNLYKYFMQTPDAKNPFGYLDQWIKDFQAKLNALQFPVSMVSATSTNASASNYAPAGLAADLAAIGVIAGYGDYASSVSNQSPNNVLNGLYGMQSAPEPMVSYNQSTGLSYNPNGVDITITGTDELTRAIANSLQVNSLSGIPSSVQRLVSTFG